mmetsp:Transcript_17099/g.34694  ORF Transcript_17099/g.34694 Transcript_17099/m.34694 type:complete len:96 (-) Transcript_17099:119-406(-)
MQVPLSRPLPLPGGGQEERERLQAEMGPLATNHRTASPPTGPTRQQLTDSAPRPPACCKPNQMRTGEAFWETGGREPPASCFQDDCILDPSGLVD